MKSTLNPTRYSDGKDGNVVSDVVTEELDLKDLLFTIQELAMLR